MRTNHLARVQIHILWLQYPCDVFLELENNPLPILGPDTPPNFKGVFGGGRQNSSQTSSLEVCFDGWIWNGSSSHRGRTLGDLCSHMSTLYPFLLLMQTIEGMTVWLMILPLIVLERLTVKIILTSSAERPNFIDRSLQLALLASHSCQGRGE